MRRARSSAGARVVVVVLAGLVAIGASAGLGGAAEPVRGLSLFPEPAPTGSAPERVPARATPGEVASALAASAVAYPGRQGWCLVGELVGFFVGSVARVPVWVVTLGDQFGSSEGLDRVGRAVVETACGDSLVVSPVDLRRGQAWEEPGASSAIETR